MDKNKIEILNALRMGLCIFTYTKLTGELRVATGTLHPQLIPEENTPKTYVGANSSKGNLVTYYDMGVKNWRSFHAENLQSLVVSEELPWEQVQKTQP